MNQPFYPELVGKVAVITGAAQGMGAFFAQGLVNYGVNVVGGDIQAELLKSTTEEINSNASSEARMISAKLDVTSPKDHENLARLALENFGQVNYWVNNAGVFPGNNVLDISQDEIKTTMAVNVNGALFGVQAAAAAMNGQSGSIVNLGSVSGFRLRPGRASYSVSKAAVDMLSRFQSLELGQQGIRVNTIAPGFIETEMTAWIRNDPDSLAKAIAGVPLGRFGTVHDILNTVLFLLSDSASYISGTTIYVDGGSRNVSMSEI